MSETQEKLPRSRRQPQPLQQGSSAHSQQAKSRDSSRLKSKSSNSIILPPTLLGSQPESSRIQQSGNAVQQSPTQNDTTPQSSTGELNLHEEFEQLLKISSSSKDTSVMKNHTDSQADQLNQNIEEYRNKSNNEDMVNLAKDLAKCVDQAKAILDAKPLLENVGGNNEGYLKLWVETFSNFVTNKKIPEFFYARYGYAIETIATRLFTARAETYKAYKVRSQVAKGDTRPDFVIQKDGTDVAWLDITSSASQGHIMNKQGSGWKQKPYVAEILYKMPVPADFADTAKESLSEEQLNALKEADEASIKKAQNFNKGMRKMGLLLGEAYAKKVSEQKSGLGKKKVRDITNEVCKAHLEKFAQKYLDKHITPKYAAGVLASIDEIEVSTPEQTNKDAGNNWAKWAKFSSIERSVGRLLLEDFGAEM